MDTPTDYTQSPRLSIGPWQPPLHVGTIADFDGDGRSDISVFRPADTNWYLDRSVEGFAAVQFGQSTDKIVPADFDGDGKTDISVYRNGTWYWLSSADGGSNSAMVRFSGSIVVSQSCSGFISPNPL